MDAPTREVFAQRTENRGGYNLIYTADDKAIIFDLRGRANEVTPTSCTCQGLRCPHKEIAFPSAGADTLLEKQLEDILVQATTLADVTTRLALFAKKLLELEETLEDQGARPEVIPDRGSDLQPEVMARDKPLDSLSNDVAVDCSLDEVNDLREQLIRREIAERSGRPFHGISLLEIARKIKFPVEGLTSSLLLRRLQNLQLHRNSRQRHRPVPHR